MTDQGTQQPAKPFEEQSFIKAVSAVARWLGIAASILSLVLLVHEAFAVSVVAPFQRILDAYAYVVDRALAPFDAPMREVLAYFRGVLDINLELRPHWRHVFVLMWVYFAGDFRSYLERKRPVSAVLTLLLGVLIAVAASVAAGATDIAHPSMLAAWFPISGFVLYEALKAPWSATFFRRTGDTWLGTCSFYLVNYALTNLVAGGAAIGASALLLARGPQQANMVAIVLFLILLVLRNVWMGHRYAKLIEVNGGTWRSRYLRSAPARLARLHTVVIVGALLFIVCNAGLDRWTEF